MGNCMNSSVADESKGSTEIPATTAINVAHGGDKPPSSVTTKNLHEEDPNGCISEEAVRLLQKDAGGLISEGSKDNNSNNSIESMSAESGDPKEEDMSEEPTSLLEKDIGGVISTEPNLTAFTLTELDTATKNFDPDYLVGEGGSGRVYRGWIYQDLMEGYKEEIDENSVAAFSYGSKALVAIKKLNPSNYLLGSQELKSEVKLMGRLSHFNLVKLLGYCREDNEHLLVYEYMPKGSLENHLFKRKHAVEVLTWERRIKIALDAARGLCFLHSLDGEIMFTEFKASNILLDVNFNAKVSDFCLPIVDISVKSADPNQTSRESNVYRFGTVLLELLSGKRVVDTTRPTEKQDLIKWALAHLTDKEELKTVLDPRLKGQYLFKAALEAAHLILKCLESDSKSRPSMQQVVESLQQLAAMKKKPNGKRVRPRSPAAPKYTSTQQQPSRHQSPNHPRYQGSPKMDKQSPNKPRYQGSPKMDNQSPHHTRYQGSSKMEKQSPHHPRYQGSPKLGKPSPIYPRYYGSPNIETETGSSSTAAGRPAKVMRTLK